MSFDPTGWTESEIAEGKRKEGLYLVWRGLVESGLSGNQAARELGEPASKFSQWAQAVAREGFAGLMPRRRACGAKARFAETKDERLETKDQTSLPGWFIRACRYFYLLSNRNSDRGSCPEAILRTISLPSLPPGWNASHVRRFLTAIGEPAEGANPCVPVCPPALREMILARRREGKAMLPRRLLQQITMPTAVVRQHRNPTNAGLDYLSAPGSAIFTISEGSLQTAAMERSAIRGAGHVVEADDATINFPVCVPWEIGGCPCSDRWGVKVGRFQWLVSVDVWSRAVLAYSFTARARSSYRGEDVVSLMRAIARAHGIPEVFRFERGVWESDIVRNAIAAMGARLHTVYSPHQKPFIEGMFNVMWTKLSLYFPDSEVGRFRGETEKANDLLVSCQRGHRDPRDHFPMLSQALEAFDCAIAEKNATPVCDQYGGRWIPQERLGTRDQGLETKFRAMDAATEWLFAACASVVTVKGNIVRARVNIMEGLSIPFDFGAPELVNFDGAKVRVYFDPHDPQCFATVCLAQAWNDRRAGEVLCVAPQVNETTGRIRMALGWGDDPGTRGRTERAKAAMAMRREVRSVLGKATRETELRDGGGNVVRVETGNASRGDAETRRFENRDQTRAPEERANRVKELEEFERANAELFV